MSDNWVTVIPLRPDHMPNPIQISQGLKVLKDIATDADEITIIQYDAVMLFDCGANFEHIECPSCRSKLNSDWWGQTMSADYDESSGFKLMDYITPCCSTPTPMHKLDYYFHQAFGRFGLSAMNPNIGELSPSDIKKIKVALGCDVTVVYQHL